MSDSIDTESLNMGLNVGIQSTLDTLIKLGLLVEMSESVGYNGKTKPEGVANGILSDEIEDCIHAKLREAMLESLEEEVADIIKGEMSLGG